MTKTIDEQINDLTKELVDINKRKQALLKEKAEAAFQDFFKNHEDIEAIVWTQGTPTWCDGGPCHFGKDDMWTIAKVDEERDAFLKEENYSNWRDFFMMYGGEEISVGYGKDKKLDKDISSLFNLPNEFFIEVCGMDEFGNAKVIVTRDGFEIFDYYPDY